MGTKYTTQSISGYNSSPPADDGTSVDSNKVEWQKHLDKIGDPIKTQVAAIDAALVTALDFSGVAKSGAYTTVAADHMRTIECTGTFTLTLGAVATMGAGYIIRVKNVGTGTITVDGTSSETIDGATSITLIPNDGVILQVNASAGAYTILARATNYATWAYDAGGTVDVITASFTPTITLSDGILVNVRASGANTSATPTFNPDSLGAKTITKNGNQALIAGDIFGADHVMQLQYNSGTDTWELLNPNSQSYTDQEVSALAAGTGDTIVYAALDLQSSVDQTDLAADSVGQSELKTTSGTVGGNLNAGVSTYYTLSGGNYGLSLYSYTTDTTESNSGWDYPGYPSVNSTYEHRIGHQNSDSTNRTLNTREYYVNSSPPYDLGDGEIPLFIYAVVDNATGEIEHYSSYVDPVWAYNGPTVVTPSRYGKDGKVYRNRRDMSGFNMTYEQAKQAGALSEYLAAFREAKIVEEEITQDIKNADMNIISHPFEGNDLTGKTVVLLDPVSKVMEDMLEIQNHDTAEIPDILMGGYLKVGNSGLNRKGPQGLLIPDVKWK